MFVELKVVWVELCIFKSDCGFGLKVLSCFDGWMERGWGGMRSLEEL